MGMRIEGAEELTPTETDMDLRSRVVSLEHQHTHALQRVGEIEKWQRQKDIEDAKRGEQWNNLLSQFDGLDKKLDGLNNNIKWVVKLVVGGIIAGFIGFMINGGFVRAQEVASVFLEPPRAILPAARPFACPIEKPVLVEAYCRALPRYRSVAPVVPVPRAPLSSEALLQ